MGKSAISLLSHEVHFGIICLMSLLLLFSIDTFRVGHQIIQKYSQRKKIRLVLLYVLLCDCFLDSQKSLRCNAKPRGFQNVIKSLHSQALLQKPFLCIVLQTHHVTKYFKDLYSKYLMYIMERLSKRKTDHGYEQYKFCDKQQSQMYQARKIENASFRLTLK